MEMSIFGPICAFGSSVTWAIGSTFYSRLLQKHSAFAVNFCRALISLPLFVLSVFVLSGGFSEGIASYQAIHLSNWGWFFLSIIAGYGLGDTVFLWSTRYLGVPGALAIASCAPIWTVFGGYFFGGESISLMRVLSIGLTVAGIVTVILNGPKVAPQSLTKKQGLNQTLKGLAMAVMTSIFWAMNGFATSRGGADLTAPVGNTIRMILALVVCTFFSAIFAPRAALLIPGRQVRGLIWVFVLEAFIGSLFYVFGMSHSPLALGATLGSLAPVISVPLAILSGLEKFSVWRSVGVITVVVGICLLLRSF